MLTQAIALFALAASAPAASATFVGTWVAAADWEGQRVELVLVLTKGGKASRTTTAEGEIGETAEGTYEAAKDMLSLDFPSGGDDHRTTALVREHTAESLVLTTFQSRTGKTLSAEWRFKRKH
jgi:hypothetical protein